MPDADYYQHDVFISHASEDQADFVRPLALLLQETGISVWYSEWALSLGDGLRKSIDDGLSRSRFGVVVLSQSFFAKGWPQRELDGLTSLEMSSGSKRILPIWHGVEVDDVARFSPTLADKFAVKSSSGLSKVVEAISQALKQAPSAPPASAGPALTSMPASSADTLKRYLSNDVHRIALHDFVASEVEQVCRLLQGTAFQDEPMPSKETIRARIFAYDSLLGRISGLAALGGYWSNSNQLADWVSAVERLANVRESMDYSYTTWLSLRFYPAMVVMYAAGMGALAKGSLGHLWRLLAKGRIRDGHEDGQPSDRLAPFLVAGGEVGKTLPGKELAFTPVSQHVFETLRPAFSQLVPDSRDYEALFDEFEVWLMLAHADSRPRDWVPVGRFGWNYLKDPARDPAKRIITSLSAATPPEVAAGTFDGDPKRARAAAEHAREFLQEIRHRWY